MHTSVSFFIHSSSVHHLICALLDMDIMDVEEELVAEYEDITLSQVWLDLLDIYITI